MIIERDRGVLPRDIFAYLGNANGIISTKAFVTQGLIADM